LKSKRGRKVLDMTKRISSLFFTLTISLIAFSLYSIPVENSYITATFMEFRATGTAPHFHSGVDFSTFLKEGIPIRAAEDGYLVRLEIDKGGIYGMTIVLEHQDGYRTLYAHLSKFSEKMDKLVSMLQSEFGDQRIEVEFSPDDIKFSKGETVGYSGRTGEATKPHAHFEVRSKDEKILYDPLKFIDKNQLRAVQSGLLLKSIVIDGKEYPYASSGTYYFSSEHPKIAVEAYTELAKNLLGIKEIKMYFSDKLVYHIILDELPMDLWEKPYELYDEKTVMTSLTYRGFYKLYSTNNLPFVKVNEVNSYTDSSYKVTIELFDDFGNQGTFTFNLAKQG